jgi:hypothetical protein
MKVFQAFISGMVAISLSSCSGEGGSSPVSTGGSGSGGFIQSTITGFALPSAPYFVAIRKGELFWTDSDPVIGLKKSPLTGGAITPLAMVYSNAIQIIKREGILYWSESLRVGRLFPDGLVEILVDGSACSHAGQNMVVDDTHVYRLAGSPTLESLSDACAITRTHLVDRTSTTVVDNPMGPIYSLIADSTHIYWAETSATDTGYLSSIKKASKATGVIQTLASGLNGFAGNLAISGSFLVFGEANGIGTARILKVPLAGGPVVILAGPPSHAETEGLRGLAVDAQNVYWIGDTTVQSVSLNGGTPRVLVTGNNQTIAIAANAIDVFWIEHVCCAGDLPSRINKIPKGGGAPTVVTDGMYEARTLSLDSTTLYWGEGLFYNHHFLGRIAKAPISGGSPMTVLSGIGKGTSAPFAIGDTGIFLAGHEAIKRIPIDGGVQVETVRWKLGSDIPAGTVTDGLYIYFFAGNVVTGQYDLLKLPVGGGVADTLFSDPPRPSGPLVVGSGIVFWIKQSFVTDPASIMRTPSAGGPTVPLVTGLTVTVTDMLVDSDALYWAEAGNAIRKIAFTGGAVTTLWPGGYRGWPEIAQDESFIYWINESQVGKVPKAGGQAAFYQVLPDYRRAIGVDDTSVYWVTDSALWRATPK